jgi:hypothetical protein
VAPSIGQIYDDIIYESGLKSNNHLISHENYRCQEKR